VPERSDVPVYSLGKSPSTTGSGDTAPLPEDVRCYSTVPLTKEKKMIRLVVFVAGTVVGALGTLVVEHPKKVATKVREAAAFAMKKIREVYEAGEPKDEKPGEGPADVAA
jgi:hypothetical protein